MVDISMCLNEDCPIKETCYRYKATANPYRQAYMDFKYDNGCEDYVVWEADNA